MVRVSLIVVVALCFGFSCIHIRPTSDCNLACSADDFAHCELAHVGCPSALKPPKSGTATAVSLALLRRLDIDGRLEEIMNMGCSWAPHCRESRMLAIDDPILRQALELFQRPVGLRLSLHQKCFGRGFLRRVSWFSCFCAYVAINKLFDWCAGLGWMRSSVHSLLADIRLTCPCLMCSL